MACIHCLDTGSRSKSVSGDLDCLCGVADQRARLNDWLRDQRRAGELVGVSEVDAWVICQRGREL